jgi:hypothetical protein
MKRPKAAANQEGIVYSAVAVSRILGLPVGCSDPVPRAAAHEIVIWYGGWDLQTLRDCAGGKKWMAQDQDWRDATGWTAEPGYYRLRLLFPNSSRKTWGDQLALLRTGDEVWHAAHILVATTALLVHLAATGNDLLQNDWCGCANPFQRGLRAVLTIDGGRVNVRIGHWDYVCHSHLWVAAARKL